MWGQVLGAARIMEISTYFSSYSRQVNVATCFLVLPIHKENLYDYWEGDYIYNIGSIIYIHIRLCSRHHILAISPAVRIYRVGDNIGTVNTTTPHILISWGQKTRVKHYYVDLSSWYEFWSAIICISINIVSDFLPQSETVSIHCR